VTAIECYFHADEMSPSEVLEQQLIGKFEMQFDLSGLCDAARLWRYSVSQRERDRADLRIEPGTEFPVSPATASFQDRPADEPDDRQQLPPGARRPWRDRRVTAAFLHRRAGPRRPVFGRCSLRYPRSP